MNTTHAVAKLLKLTFTTIFFKSIYDQFRVLSACGIRKEEKK